MFYFWWFKGFITTDDISDSGNLPAYNQSLDLLARGAWLAAVHGVTKESDTIEQLTLTFYLQLLHFILPPLLHKW